MSARNADVDVVELEHGKGGSGAASRPIARARVRGHRELAAAGRRADTPPRRPHRHTARTYRLMLRSFALYVQDRTRPARQRPTPSRSGLRPGLQSATCRAPITETGTRRAATRPRSPSSSPRCAGSRAGWRSTTTWAAGRCAHPAPRQGRPRRPAAAARAHTSSSCARVLAMPDRATTRVASATSRAVELLAHAGLRRAEAAGAALGAHHPS